ncbi:uncharacterized protein LOC131874596 isoform X2 [Cryptomeria japonica]|uniref:uncharacterized protein LOC131874596 isoform X2 n=1 Tax=Cryptomeria japonica TaxID=3369 RepID=UPI0027D9DB04|nr:uncharacterized protein LOC131874596 isoform X2 [Cryptomeria japonica]
MILTRRLHIMLWRKFKPELFLLMNRHLFSEASVEIPLSRHCICCDLPTHISQVLTRTCCFSRAITKLLYTIMVPSLAFNKSLGDNKRTLVHLLPHSSQETTTIPFCFQWPPFQVISKRSHLHIMYLANQAIVGFSFVNKIFHHEMEVAYSHPEATMEDMHNQIFYSHRVSRRSCSPCFQSSTTTLLANY